MSLPHPPPTHAHLTEYADPVLRAPSPTSSIGTAYPADQISFSDSEAQISPWSFERKVLEKIRLDDPREEEIRAEREVLVMVPVPLLDGGQGQKMVRAWDVLHKLPPVESKALFERIMTSLRTEVAKLQDDELFEEILRRGSKAALETQPTSNDIDALMRSMMGPAMNLGSSAPGHVRTDSRVQAHLGRSTSGGLAPTQSQPSRNDFFQSQNQTQGAGVGLNHPQPQHGAFRFEQRDGSSTPYGQPSAALLMSEVSGATVGGKRSRNGTSRRRNP